MYQNTLNDESEFYDPPERLDTDEEYINKGYVPLGAVLTGGDYIFCDFIGAYENAFQEGLYLKDKDLVYFNGDWFIKPLRVIYSWE